MRFLKILGIFILSLVVLFLLLGLILPKSYEVSRDVTIDAPRPLVFQHVRTLQAMQEWSPWNDLDPNQEIRYEGEDGTVGAEMHWSGSKDVGKGLQRIVDLKENERIATKLVFLEPFSSEADVEMALSEAQGGVNVRWTMEGETPFPWNALTPILGFKKAIANDFDKGLSKLKSLVEEQAANPMYDGYKIEVAAIQPTLYIGYRSQVAWADMDRFFQTQMPALYRESMRLKAVMAGPPSALFYEWDEVSQRADLAVVLPVEAEVNLRGGMIERLPAGRAAIIDYYGPYDGTGAAHEAMDAFVKDFGYHVKGPVIEAYITDPATEPDTAKWHTRVIYPLSTGEE